jgi:Domain of unknown function (DUF1905)/Bacteriocin-protection, YdeI or OmpD-Associated
MPHIELQNALIQRFNQQGEKTSWSFIEIPALLAVTIHASDKKSFRGKGTFDGHAFAQIGLVPMGEGNYILPFNAGHRKTTGKKPGDTVHLILEKDLSEWILNPDLEACLMDAPGLYERFTKLPKGHQRYFSNWIEGTKNPTLRADRIFKTLFAIEHKMDYGQMIRHFKQK